MNMQFPQGETETVNKHLRKCSALVVIKEMQIKATLKCHLTPTKLAFLKMMAGEVTVILAHSFISGGTAN